MDERRSASDIPGQQTLILIGLDGFRWDYIDRYDTPNLRRLAATGVRSELVPVFPSLTFVNFYALATGLYPEHNGVVSNWMHDPKIAAEMREGARTSPWQDGRWFGGEPIWSTAERQGARAATFFWLGSEAEIAGRRPTMYKRYDESIPHEQRVDTVLAWLDLPRDRRPRLLTLYFEDVDEASHQSGMGTPEERAAIGRVDASIGRLLRGLSDRGLAGRVNIMVVADHGMTPTRSDRIIYLDDYIDLKAVRVLEVQPGFASPTISVFPAGSDVESAYRKLAGAHPHLRVYRKADIPERFHVKAHPRTPPLIGFADEGWVVSSRAALANDRSRVFKAMHGYDNQLRSMHAIFLAHGPAFRRGVVALPFENVNVYTLATAALGLVPAPHDGRLDAVPGILVPNVEAAARARERAAVRDTASP